jgi:hypothetical protein
MNPASPLPETPPDDAARTCAYLRLHGLSAQEAGQFANRSLAEIQEDLDAWAASLVAVRPDEGELPHRARGRAQLLLARALARWPGCFLHPAPPPGLAGAVQAVALQATRSTRQTSMTPQPIDLGPISEVADETWKTFDKWPVLRGLTLWLLFSLLLVTVFYVVRF